MNADNRLRVYIGPRRKRKDGGYYPRWPFRYRLPGKKWVHGTGGFTEASTRQLVDKLIQEDLLRTKLAEHGMSNAPKVPVQKHIDEYLEWGRHGGGKGGRAWSADHYVHRKLQLREWMRVLTPLSLDDITYDAFAAENTRRLAAGAAPNTVNHHAWALVAFLKWCRQRARIAENRLEHFLSLDRKPVHERGAFDAAEFRALLRAAPLKRQLLYRTAIYTGFRRSALASLTVASVDWDGGIVTLHWGSSKSRKTVLKPLPRILLADLSAHSAGKGEREPLLEFAPRQAARNIHRDMAKAGIPITKGQRRRDFHSLKASLGTLLDDLGTLPEITQKALDHASFRQTQAYIKREIAPLREAVEELERKIGGDEFNAAVTETGKSPDFSTLESAVAGTSHPGRPPLSMHLLPLPVSVPSPCSPVAPIEEWSLSVVGLA